MKSSMFGVSVFGVRRGHYCGAGHNYSAGFNSWRIIFQIQLQDRGPGELSSIAVTGLRVFLGKTAPAGPKEITGPGPTGINFELQLQEYPVSEFKM